MAVVREFHQRKLAGNKIGTTLKKQGFDDFVLANLDQQGHGTKDPTLST